MILFSMGLPGLFAQWCEAVMARLAAQGGGIALCRTFPSLQDMFGYAPISGDLTELGRMLIGNDVEHLVIGVRQPDPTLRRTLDQCRTPFLVALDDPRDAVGALIAKTGIDAGLAVRAVANCCPLLLQTCNLPGALTIHADHARGDPAGAIVAIAGHLGIELPPGTARQIVAELAAGDDWAMPAAQTPMAALPPAAREMCDGALRSYRDLFRGGNFGDLVWKRGLFTVADGTSPAAPIEVAGGGRILIYGPYILLPSGSWTAEIVLGFSAEAAACTYLVDAFAESQLAATTFRPGGAGVFRAELAFSVGEPNGRGVEIRVGVTDYNARGQMAFGQVLMRPLVVRQNDATAPGEEDFTIVLGL